MRAAVTGAAELCSVPAAAMDAGARGFRVPGQGWSAPGDAPSTSGLVVLLESEGGGVSAARRQGG